MQDYESSAYYINSLILQYSEKSKAFSFESIARKGNFSSRGFVRDLLNGRRNMTEASAKKFARALKLSQIEENYLFALVELESLKRKKANPERVLTAQKTLERLSSLLRSRTLSWMTEFPELYMWPVVYAALGTPESGATLLEISRRTKISEKSLVRVLGKLVEIQLVEYDADKKCYFAKANHLVFKSLKKSQYFKTWYIDLLEKNRSRAETGFESSGEFFFSSTLSISSSAMANLKTKLNETILEFVDQSEDPRGDSVVHIQLGMFKN